MPVARINRQASASGVTISICTLAFLAPQGR